LPLNVQLPTFSVQRSTPEHAETGQEARETTFGALGTDGDGEGFGLADEDDKLFAARDGGVEKIALEEEVLLHGEGDDDGGEL
jgi:hypothetical protein